MPNFDKNKEYGYYIIVFSEDEIEQAKEIVWDNAKLCIPTEFHDSIDGPLTMHSPACTITVKDDNYEMLGVQKENIGEVFQADERWLVGWVYSPKKEVVNA